MPGSLTGAEDAVQGAWCRISRSDGEAVANRGGWLTTVVARVCLDERRERRARREQALDKFTPEPIVRVEEGPEEQAVLADSVGIALLVVLETLTPAERPAFVLHDMFAVPFSEIAEVLQRSPDATRQPPSRAPRLAVDRLCRRGSNGDDARSIRCTCWRSASSGPSTTPSHPSRSVRTQPQTLTSRVRMPVESIQTRESLLTIFARTLSQCGQRRTMPAPR